MTTLPSMMREEGRGDVSDKMLDGKKLFKTALRMPKDGEKKDGRGGGEGGDNP